MDTCAQALFQVVIQSYIELTWCDLKVLFLDLQKHLRIPLLIGLVVRFTA